MLPGNSPRRYVVPRYRESGDAAFHHVLHGAVPGHQMDFLYCPELPQGALTQTHFGHLARLMQHIEPRPGADHAFALGNLSRDDVQHDPGHGGLALLFATRVPGLTDHAGRDMLPYAHALVAADRALDSATLLDAALVFHRRFVEGSGSSAAGGDFYREYIRTMERRPADVAALLARAVAQWDDLPCPPRSCLGWAFEAPEIEAHRRVVIVHDDRQPFAAIARCAAAVAAMLYRSNVRWTSISTGRDLDIAGGTTVRFVPASEATSGDGALVLRIEEVPSDEDSMAALLFGARRRAREAPPARVPWRARGAPQTRRGPAASPAQSRLPARTALPPAVKVPPAPAQSRLPARSPSAARPARMQRSVASRQWFVAIFALIGLGAVFVWVAQLPDTPPSPAAHAPERHAPLEAPPAADAPTTQSASPAETAPPPEGTPAATPSPGPDDAAKKPSPSIPGGASRIKPTAQIKPPAAARPPMAGGARDW